MKTIARTVFAALLALSGAGGFYLGSGTHVVTAQSLAGPVILTVTGDITRPNRGPLDPANDKFLGRADIPFKDGTTFDAATLEQLDRVKVKADFPKGETVHTFEGPTLASVLEAAGAKGAKVTLVALDGYMVEMPLTELLRQGAVLALKRDGQPLGIGDFGPMQVVFPRADRSDLKDMTDDAWIWSVYHIHID